MRPKANPARLLMPVPITEISPALLTLARQKNLVDDDGFVHIRRRHVGYAKSATEVFSQDGKQKYALQGAGK